MLVEHRDIVVHCARRQLELRGNLFFAVPFQEERERFAEPFREAVARDVIFSRQPNSHERRDLVVKELEAGA